MSFVENKDGRYVRYLFRTMLEQRNTNGPVSSSNRSSRKVRSQSWRTRGLLHRAPLKSRQVLERRADMLDHQEKTTFAPGDAISWSYFFDSADEESQIVSFQMTAPRLSVRSRLQAEPWPVLWGDCREQVVGVAASIVLYKASRRLSSAPRCNMKWVKIPRQRAPPALSIRITQVRVWRTLEASF